jgi:hypothetical protein
MSLLLTCRVTIGQLVYTKISGYESESSWKTLGDTATVRLYGFVRVEDPDTLTDASFSGSIQKVEDLVKVGDAVKIELGYDGDLRTEFEGYVAEIKLKIPFEIRCEDEYWKLKRTPINKTFKKTTLKKLLGELVPGVKLSASVPSIEIDAFRADRTTVAKVLQTIKENYLVCTYFRDKVLFVGLPYTEFQSYSGPDGSLAKYAFQQNVIDDDLTYKRAEDVRIKAKVIAYHRNGKKTTVPDVGDTDGEERTITLRTETTDVAELKRLAVQKLSGFKYDGYRGSLTSFGVPFILHSGVAVLIDDAHPQRAGNYLVDKVKTTFGTDGFRRTIDLGKRITL